MAYDFKDLPAFKGVWVFCEQRGGEMMPTDEELLSRARVLADELGEEVVGIVLGGKGIAEKAKYLGGYGADKIIATIHSIPCAAQNRDCGLYDNPSWRL